MLLPSILVGVIALVHAARGLEVKSRPAPGSDIQPINSKTLLSTGPKGSQLWRLEVPSSVYADFPYVLNLTHSTSYNQGYDNAYLLGQWYIENYNALMKSLLGDTWWEPTVQKILGVFLSWQWNAYLSVQVPEQYKEELRGMDEGGKAAGLDAKIGQIAAWGITLANFPGTIPNIKFVLADEKAHPAHGGDNEFFAALKQAGYSFDDFLKLLEKIENNWNGLTCSMYGVWGSRTDGGKLYTGRNLDWLKASGISKYKLITVHHPVNGYSHATFGWAGIWGAITGMSSQGITVHEANLESNDITFRGFPWVLRLRHVMANAKNINEGLAVWNATNNTIGFNHQIASAQDNSAVDLETMMGNSAVFADNDPREKNYVVNGMDIGQSRPEAVFRTNHGYDQYTISHYMWNDTQWYNNSITRYMIFPTMFDMYQQSNTKITYVEAVNITALVGDKGDLAYWSRCDIPYTDGSNILSVTYDPKELIAYAAWETGTSDADWVPAACNTYLTIDMKPWFSSSQQ